MKKRYALGTVAAVGLVFVLACITVNIYFPEATVKQAAGEIVERDPQERRRRRRRRSRSRRSPPSAEGPPSPSSPRPMPRRRRPSRRRPSGPSRTP